MTARTRLGLVVPSTNTTVEREITRSLPDEVDWFATRVLQRETEDPAEKAATVLAMRDELGSAVQRLVGLGPAAIGFACTAASFLDGLASDVALCGELGETAGVPFLTASRAVSSALGALLVTRIALVTPYIDTINEREVSYFAEAGFQTTTAFGLGIVGNLPKGRLPLAASADAVREAGVGGADAVFVSCTNWLTLGNVEPLERELGLPVVSSNSALLWAMARACGIRSDLAGLGRLGTVGGRAS